MRCGEGVSPGRGLALNHTISPTVGMSILTASYHIGII